MTAADQDWEPLTWLSKRRVEAKFCLDTNIINARQKLPNINRLEQWAKDGVILMELAEATFAELTSHSIQAEKAAQYTFSIPVLGAGYRDLLLLRKIAGIIFPEGAKTPQEKIDILIVFTAAKYDAILITADGASRRQPRGILGSQKDLKAIGIRVMSDKEAVRHVEGLIKERDSLAQQHLPKFNYPIPCWVGGINVADPVKHVVLLMLENHSFDQMLGIMKDICPELEGIDSKTPNSAVGAGKL